MIIVPLFLAGTALGAWLVWRSPARRQRAHAQARAALLGQLFAMTDLRWWSDEQVQSARILADRLVDSTALAAYVETYADGDEVARRISAYQSTMAKEWTRRSPPAPPAFSRELPELVLVGGVQRPERN